MFASLEDNDLETLNVPTWTHIQKTPVINNGSVKRHSLSLDSMWDDTESSVTTCPATHQSIESKDTRRQSRDVLKMLHQIQADILVKNELIGHLEKQKSQFSQMETSYNEKISDLKTQLDMIKHPRTMQQMRSQYEIKLKRLTSENLELKKSLAHTTQQLHQTRTKSESTITKLKSDTEALKLDKGQLVKQVKHTSDKAQALEAQHQKNSQNIKRRIHVALQAKSKIEKANDIQAKALQKRSEEAAAAAMQLRQLTNTLRKAASEGSFLNEATCEKILATSSSSK